MKFEKKRKTGEQRESIEFFAKFLTCDCERVAIENPVGIFSGDCIQKYFPDLAEKYGLPIKPTQIIHPWQFGHPEKKSLEQVGRVCYKSEDRITEESAKQFVAGIIKRGHESVIEHLNITVKFITDRGNSHEIVRHRIASYAQESTRYCNCNKDNLTTR